MIILISLIFLASFFLFACNTKPDRKTGFLPNNTQKADQEVSINGQVDEPIPWSEKSKLEKLKQRYGTPRLMAAYRATLPDPIFNEAYNIKLAADTLAGTVVQPGEVFSQTERLAPYSREKGYKEGPAYSNSRVVPAVGGGVCKIASFLYNVTILSNLPVIERHPHSMPVPYVPTGQDATVTTGVHDFKFKNNTKGPILIWADKIGKTLYMAFYGQEKPPRIIWGHKTIEEYPFETVTYYNSLLSQGKKKVVLPGAKGVKVRSWINIKRNDGTYERKDLGVDYYSPFPRIIEQGTK